MACVCVGPDKILHKNPANAASMVQNQPQQVRTDITIDSINLPDNKRIKQNITVEQDYDGVANKFTAYNADCQGTMTINRPDGFTSQHDPYNQQQQHYNIDPYSQQQMVNLRQKMTSGGSATSSGTSGTGDLGHGYGSQQQQQIYQGQGEVNYYNGGFDIGSIIKSQSGEQQRYF